jgi:predicted Zn-dependent peptidase
MTYTRKTLSNGIKLITAPMHETKAVTVLVMVGVGSRYETPHLNGGSHFIEHLLFKGTKRRPTALDITKELDGVGAEYNAFTSKDYTGYYIKIDGDKLELAVDILGDMIWHSTYQPSEVERERGVIIEEINMYEDNPMMHMEDLFEQTMFGTHPLGWLISGTRETMKAMRRSTLLKFRNATYRPDNMVIAVAGRFDAKHLETLLRDHFGSQKSVRGRAPKFRRYSGKPGSPRVMVQKKETEQVQVALGVPAVSGTHPDLAALSLLGTILGGNMSSRLFMEVREKRGLAYFVRAGAGTYQDTGTFMVQAGLERTRIEEAITAILVELGKVAKRGVTSAELARAKEYAHGKLVLELEDSQSIASFAGRQLLLNRKFETPEQKMAKLRTVTRSDIQRVAAKYFRRRALSLALIGPFSDPKPFRKLLERAPLR